MELTPQLLAEVEFRDTLRGYDRDEVDTFLEQVGVAIAQLQGRLEEAVARAETRGGAVADGDAVSTDTITRTLLLAQQTADATVAGAETEAVQMVDDARQEAVRLRSEAEADRAAVLAETESEARQVAEEARRDLLDELGRLEARRDEARRELAALDHALGAERSKVRDAAGHLLALAEGGLLGDALDDARAPEPLTIGDPDGARPDDDRPDDHDAADDATVADIEPAADVAADEADPGTDDGDVSDADEIEVSSESPAIDLADRPAPFDVEAAELDLSDTDQPADGPTDPEPGASVFDEGPATQAVDVLALADEESDEQTDDVFVQQLRKAVSPSAEHEGEAMAEFFDVDEGPRRLLGRDSD